MDIGTAKPTAEQQNQCPHHLLDVLCPEETYSAGAYERASRSIIEQVWNRGGLPIMVGGTGLYWQSALDGCFEDATEYAPTRAELQNRLHCEGLPPYTRSWAVEIRSRKRGCSRVTHSESCGLWR